MKVITQIMNLFLHLLLWFFMGFLLYIRAIDIFGFGFGLILGEIALKVELIKSFQLGKIILKLRKLEKEIYARMDTVQDLAKNMSKVTAYSLSCVGGFAPTNLEEKLKEGKETLVSLLRKMDIPENEINNCLTPLTEKLDRYSKKGTV